MRKMLLEKKLAADERLLPLAIITVCLEAVDDNRKRYGKEETEKAFLKEVFVK